MSPTYPMDMVRVDFYAYRENPHTKDRGMFHALSTVSPEEGPRALYKAGFLRLLELGRRTLYLVIMTSAKAGVRLELRKNCMKSLFVFFCLSVTVTPFTQCEARVSTPLKSSAHPKHIPSSRSSITKTTHYFKMSRHLEMDPATDLTNTQPYVSSPFTLPPFDSLAPLPLPQNTPPYCEYPPSIPQPPSTQIPTPIIYTSPPPPPPTSYSAPIVPAQNPPPSPTFDVPSPPESSPIPNPPEYGPSPPTTSYSAPIVPAQNPPPSPTFDVPSPPESSPTPNPPEYGPTPPSFPGTPGTPEYVPTPPDYYVPGPPEAVPGTPGYESSPPIYIPSPPQTGTPVYEPSPPIYIPSPSGYTPSPVFQPPVIYPPPSVPPPPHKAPHYALWCVVKPSVPDPIIQEAMNYACGSGADCNSIQPSGSCYQPDTLYAHASYAFNSYWQRTKVAGGTCDFGGTGMLVTVDP
ncbi:hypothetical protein IFM89_004488, partial [Coptis chinensis]